MKKVIKDEMLWDKMASAINLLGDTVKSTLGPKGSNIIIDHSLFSPFITNDGVTIAMNIESEDEVINTILELAKEAAIKTNDLVGDGTTTTLVLLQSIFNQGLELIRKGKNPLILKKELFANICPLEEKIKQYSRKPHKEELKQIASISSNDTAIGNLIAKTYVKILNKDAIDIKEGEEETLVKFIKGYFLETNLASPYFLEGEKELKLLTPQLLIIDNHLESLEEIKEIINNVIISNTNLVIIANSYNEYLIDEVINLNRENNYHIILMKSPYYGKRREDTLKDLSVISGASIVKDYFDLTTKALGGLEYIQITLENTIFKFSSNEQIKSWVQKLKKNPNEYTAKRITMLTKENATILVGGVTKTERREKKMRFDDALCAVAAASNGVIPGEGIVYAKVSDTLKGETDGEKIIKESLKAPLKTILQNAGLNEEVYNNLQKHNYDLIYNVNNDTYEEYEKTLVIDPTEVVVNALKNAISIAGMLLTTTSIVINEHEHNLNDKQEYNEF